MRRSRALFLTLILLVTIIHPFLTIIPQAQASPGMEQVIFGGEWDRLHDTDTEYNSLNSGRVWHATEFVRSKIVSTDGVIKQLRVRLYDDAGADAAPGAGKKYTFTLILNGNPTALTLDIADAATSNSNMVNEISVTGGDTVSLECNPDGTPTVLRAAWATVFEGDIAKESLILGGSSDTLREVNTEYSHIMCSYNDYSITENNFRQVVPTAGTIKNFYVELDIDPGTAPDAYRFTLRKGGISQTLTVTITADDTTGNDLANSVAVVAGDVLTLMIEPLNGPAAIPHAVWGMTFVADTDGESIVLGGTLNDLSDINTEYIYIATFNSDIWNTIESHVRQMGQTCTLKNLHMLLSVAPGAGNDYEFRIRVAGADSDVGVLIKNLETTGHSSMSATANIANDDYVGLQVVPTGGPDIADAYWGLVCYTGPAVESPYTPKFASFSIGADGAWTDYDLFTNQGVPKGRVAEIVCYNKNEDFARIVGVRTDQSTAGNRYIDIHEAEGGGVTTTTMFVKCHETTGLIECYSEIDADCEFVLLGYFDEDFDFTESITSLGQPGLAWAELDLTASSVPNDAVVQILMGNEAVAAEFFAGVRASGSGLERGVFLEEAENGAKSPGDAWSTLSMVVQSDSDAIIEWKGGSVTDVSMWLLGWFGSTINFTENWVEYSPVADNTWESKTIAEAVASSVAVFAMMHSDGGTQQVTGLREEGSILARTITEHEAEAGGDTGFQACVTLDTDKKCEVYGTDASEANNYYTGYFTIEAPEEYIENEGIVASDSTVDDEQWFFLNASIEILTDTSTFLFNRIDLDPNGLNLSCSYTNSTDTFVEENDPNNYLELDVVISVKIDENSTFVRIDYYLRLHTNVTKDGLYNVTVYSTASGDLDDTDTFTDVFTLTIRTPSAPTKLFGAGFNSSSPYVELHWKHDLLIFSLFEVQNSSNNADWTYLGQNTTAWYTDSSVSNGTERYYKVRACRDTGAGWKNSSFTGSNFEIVYFVQAADNGDTYVTGSIGIFLMAFIILLPIIFYAGKKK